MSESAVLLRNEPERVEEAVRVGRGREQEEKEAGRKTTWRRRIEGQVGGLRRLSMDGIEYRSLQASFKKKKKSGKGGEGFATEGDAVEVAERVDENE